MDKPKARQSSKLLIQEQPLQVLPALAVALGLNEAIILQQLHYWLGRKSKTRDGREWYYNTYEQWKEQFPFWSISTIKRAVISLEKSGAITTANYNHSHIDKTKWYAINYDKLNELGDLPTAQNEPSTDHNEPSTDQVDTTTGQNDTLHGSFCTDQYQETISETTNKDLLPPPLAPFAPQEHRQSPEMPPTLPMGEGTNENRTKQDAKVKKPKPQPNNFFTPAFERAWAAVPAGRKVGKVEAFAKWQERALEGRTEEIIEKLERLKLTLWKDKELKYIPLGSTWFSEARYEDELVPMDWSVTTSTNGQRPKLEVYL